MKKSLSWVTWPRPGALGALCLLAGCGATVSPAALTDRARQELAAGEYRSAFIDLENALGQEEQNAPARLLLAEVQLQTGATAQAAQELERAQADGAQGGAVARLRARIALAEGHADAVVAPDGTMLEGLPAAERAQLRGEAFLQLTRFPEAGREFMRLQGSLPAAAHAGLAEVLLGEGRLDEALKETQFVESSHGPMAQMWVVRAAVHGRRNERPQMKDALVAATRQAARDLSVPRQMLLLDQLLQVSLSLGDLKSADDAYRHLLDIARDTPLERMDAGRLALARKDYSAAVTALQGAVAGMPSNAQARLLLGRALLAKDDISAALQTLEDTVRLAPGDVEPRRLLVLAQMRAGRAHGAADVLAPIADAVAKDPSLAVLAGLAYLKSGEAGRAIGTLERAAQASPDSTEIPLLLISADLAAGQSGKSFALADQLLATHSDPATLLRLAAILADNEELARAGQVYQKLLAADPSNQAAGLALAGLWLRLGDRGAARVQWEKLRAADPHAVQARLLLASLELRDKHPEQASILINEAVGAAASRADGLAAAGRIYLEAGLQEAALGRFGEATQLDPRHAEAWLGACAAQLSLSHLPEAEEAARRALVLAPDSLPAIRALTQVELRSHPEAALHRAQEAAKAHPYDAGAWELQGDVLMAGKKFEWAADAYAKAAELAPAAVLLQKSVQARRAAGLSDALSPMELWIFERPGDKTARRLLAEDYRQAGRAADAQRLLAPAAAPRARVAGR